MLKTLLSRSLRLPAAVTALGGGAALLASAPPPASAAAPAAAAAAALSADEWRPLRLLEAKPLTSGGASAPTRLLRFAAADQGPLPVASCVLTRCPDGAKGDGSQAFVVRPYTPVASPKGTVDLAVKCYPDGKMSRHLAALQPGDLLDFKGPLPKIAVDQLLSRPAVGMVAGGTGITPMLQVVEELAARRYAGRVSLLYASVTEADVLLKDRLDALAAQHPRMFSVAYVVDKASDPRRWKGETGYVTADMLRRHMPAPGGGAMVLVCGPPPMMKAVSGEKVSPRDQGPLSGLLAAAGYAAADVFKF